MRACPQCAAPCEPSHPYCPGCGFPIGAVKLTSEDKLVGQALPGGYLVLDLLSVGGMGRVYRAEQRALGRTVAVKVIHPHLLSDENSIMRFMTEARAASRLNHPNSVSVIDFGKTADGQPYLVMEFLHGKDLARVLHEEGPIPIKRIVDVLRQVLLALGEAHAMDIIHRDLKPENIILEPLRRGGDFVKVVDFGLAKLKADAPGALSNVTMPGIVCGTPDYMAPEQGRGDEIDGRSDLYAVGVILFQLLTGKVPFDADSPTRVVMMHITTPPPDPRQVAPDREIPEALVAVTMKALAKKPEQRYQDAHEFALALEAALDGARRSSRPQRLSLRPGKLIECSACGATVPAARFCCECAARLPAESGTPGPVSLHALPLRLSAREEELAWLDERRLQALSAGPVVARLAGEPGFGKTRLLGEFLEHRKTQGDIVVLCGPDPYWAKVGYHALRRAIAGLVRAGSNSGERQSWSGANSTTRAALEEIFSGLPRGAVSGNPRERRRAAAEALRWALTRAHTLAPTATVLLAIDDLDRVDGASQQAFADVCNAPPPGPFLLLAAHTADHSPGWGDEEGVRLLSGLPLPTVMRLMKSVGPSERIAAMSESAVRGISPLYVEQVLRFSAEGGSDPPLKLADLISHRMDTLSPDARRALQALGVLGDNTRVADLAELLGRTDGPTAALPELRTAGMVTLAGDVVSVAHPLLRDIVLAVMPVGVRRELHQRAVALYDKREAPIEARALHAYYAQDCLEALLLLEQVADRALSRSDLQAAVDALRRALELARQDVSKGELDDPLRAVAIFGRKLGDVLTLVGDYSDAEGVLREALDMAGPADTDRVQILTSLARVSQGRERRDEAVDYLNKAIDVARKAGAHELVADLRATRREWAS